MKSSLVIVNWNGEKDTIECISSIVRLEQKKHTIFLLDNGSKKESIDHLSNWLYESEFNHFIFSSTEFFSIKEFEEGAIYLIKNEKNLGFAKGNNLIVSHIYTMFEYTTLLNNDTVVTENALSDMVDCMEKNNEIGVLSCNIRLYSNKEKLWNAGGKFTWYGDRKYYSQKKIDSLIDKKNYLIKTPFVTGCVMMFRKSILQEYGMLSEQFFFGEEDFNYCFKLNKDKIEVKTLLSSKIYHKVNASISKASQGENMILRKNILHFTNRILNLKNFYSPLYWKMWKYVYLFVISAKLSLQSKSFNTGKIFRKYVNNYVNLYDSVDYELFIEINNLSI